MSCLGRRQCGLPLWLAVPVVWSRRRGMAETNSQAHGHFLCRCRLPMQTGLDRVCLRTNLLAIGPALHISAPVRRGAVADAARPSVALRCDRAFRHGYIDL